MRDTGEGIASADQQRIFERFARATNSDCYSEGEGVGLGLSIIEATVTAYSGWVELDSSLGYGTFTIVIPLVSALDRPCQCTNTAKQCKIYVVGGRKFFKNADGTTRQVRDTPQMLDGASSDFVNVPNLEVYDPKLDRWQTRSPMPQAQGGLAATSLNGKLYVFGGEQWVLEQKVFAESWIYDPKTNVWEALPLLPTP